LKSFDKYGHLVENYRMKKQYVQLNQIDREFLEALISKGALKAKAYRRAFSLFELDRVQPKAIAPDEEGQTYEPTQTQKAPTLPFTRPPSV
jgi:hypothetical protein